MEIYRIENRLFMIIDVTESFTFEAKQAADLKSEIVQKWETLMGTFQHRCVRRSPAKNGSA